MYCPTCNNQLSSNSSCSSPDSFCLSSNSSCSSPDSFYSSPDSSCASSNSFCSSPSPIGVYLAKFRRILRTMIHGMTAPKLADSISYNFMVQMIPHHQAAIEMSRNILSYTTDPALRSIAARIITEQTESIAQMNAILYRCGGFSNSSQDLCQFQYQMDQIMTTMFFQMSHAPSTGNASIDFMQEMIPHHEGAIKMSETTLQYSICPELKPILSAIIVSQKEGVRNMEGLLQRMR